MPCKRRKGRREGCLGVWVDSLKTTSVPTTARGASYAPQWRPLLPNTDPRVPSVSGRARGVCLAGLTTVSQHRTKLASPQHSGHAPPRHVSAALVSPD